jgi:hypothetical protein
VQKVPWTHATNTESLQKVFYSTYCARLCFAACSRSLHFSRLSFVRSNSLSTNGPELHCFSLYSISSYPPHAILLSHLTGGKDYWYFPERWEKLASSPHKLLWPCWRQRWERYSSYSFLTSALDGVSGQCHAPAALYPREWIPVSTGQEVGWASELAWTQARGKILCHTWGSNPGCLVCSQKL